MKETQSEVIGRTVPRAVGARVCIIILTLNQRVTTMRCLGSLYATANVPFHTIVWDNGSTDDTADAVREEYPFVLVHQHAENLGVAGGRNAAAALAVERFKPEYLLFLDNDMVVTPGFVRALMRPFNHDQRLGQTQAKLRFARDRQRLNDGGGNRVQFWLGRTRPVGFGEIDRGQYDRPAPCIACGGAMMVRADLFQQLGGFDSVFSPFGPEDVDFSLRLRKAGYRALYVPQALAYHEVSHTFEPRGYSEKYARHKSRHWFILLKRHASLPEKLGFFLLGAPYRFLIVLIREGGKGNLSALRGLFRGLVDFWKSSAAAGK